SEESMKLLFKSMVIADPKAPKFEAEMSARFTGRDGNRMRTELTIPVPRARLAVTAVAGTKTYRVDVIGEVLKDDKLFEKYRYRFDFPADTKLDLLPVIVDRLLPHGAYVLRVKVADAESHAEAIIERGIDVPEVDALPGSSAAGGPKSGLPEVTLRILP